MRISGKLIEQFIRSYVKASHFFKAHETESMKILAKYLRIENTDIVGGLSLVPGCFSGKAVRYGGLAEYCR